MGKTEVVKPVEPLDKLSEMVGTKLVWKADNEFASKEEEVTAYAVGQVYGIKKESESQEMLDTVKNKKKKEAKAGDNQVKTNVRNVDQSLTNRTIQYLKKYVRLLTRDGRLSTYILTETSLDLYKVGFLPTSSIQLAEIISIIRQQNAAEYSAWRKDVQQIIEDNVTLYMAAKRVAIPEIGDVMLWAFKKILIDQDVEECILSGSLPLMAWDENAFVRFDSTKCVPGPWPHLKRFIARVDHPDQLMAFIWKCFDPEDFGRQMVWSQSLGHSGQSTFWNVVYEHLQKIAVVLQKTSYANQFTAAKCYLKRFAMAPDCSNKYYLGSELVKQLTGGDMGEMEIKFISSFAAKLFARVVAHSNVAPEVDTTNNAMRTRLLYFVVQPFNEEEADSEVISRYREEFWHFLHACGVVHEKLCKKQDGKYRDIKVPETMWDNIKLRCDKPIRNVVRSYIENNLVVDNTAKVYEEDLWKWFRPHYQRAMRNSPDSRTTLVREKETVLQTFDNLIKGMVGTDTKNKTGCMKSGDFGARVFHGVRWKGRDNELTEASIEEEEEGFVL
jgi:hypothetical protein